MERRALTIPEIGLIAGTRAALGAGLGLLLGEYMTREQRRAVGWTLLGVGVVSTIPIAVQLIGGHGDGSEHEPVREEGGWQRAARRMAESAAV
jgi:hypothetical protein